MSENISRSLSMWRDEGLAATAVILFLAYLSPAKGRLGASQDNKNTGILTVY